jgi:putative oxidoreductase
MTDLRTVPYAALLLRISLGVMFLAHAAVKLFIFTPAGTAQFFSSVGLPPFFAYIVICAEVCGGAALILGIWPRIVALLLTPILFGAIASVHAANGWLFTNPNGGWEYPAFWAVGLIALALIGDGALALVPTPPIDRAART